MSGGPNDLRFNVSRADGLALWAVVRGQEIGIDVERIRPEPDAHKLAELFLVQERSLLEQLFSDEFQNSLFRCCTVKEAYSKAE